MKFPTEIKVLDSVYKVLYFNNASDVCIMGRYNKLYEVDFWTNEIRIFKDDNSVEFEIWNRIWVSLVDILFNKFHIYDIIDPEVKDRHKALFSMGISSVLMDNQIISNRKEFPKEVKIFDSKYFISYFDKASQVDHGKRNSLFGQFDGWDCKINVYKGSYGTSDIWQTIWHEIVHGILDKLYLKLSENEVFVDLMATGINSIMSDNESFINRFELGEQVQEK